MENFALKHPVITSLIVFLTVFIGGTVVVMFFGRLMVADCNPSPAETCDGVGLIIMALWMLTLPTSLILGIIGGASTLVILMQKIKIKEDQSYK